MVTFYGKTSYRYSGDGEYYLFYGETMVGVAYRMASDFLFFKAGELNTGIPYRTMKELMFAIEIARGAPPTSKGTGE